MVERVTLTLLGQKFTADAHKARIINHINVVNKLNTCICRLIQQLMCS